MCPLHAPIGGPKALEDLANLPLCGRWFTSVETDPFDENGGGFNVLSAEIEDLFCPPYLLWLTCAFCFLPTFSQAFSSFLAGRVADNKVW